MTTEQALARIYDSVLQDEGAVEAREYVSIIVNNVIDDLQLEGLPVSPENIRERVCHKARHYGCDQNEEIA